MLKWTVEGGVGWVSIMVYLPSSRVRKYRCVGALTLEIVRELNVCLTAGRRKNMQVGDGRNKALKPGGWAVSVTSWFSLVIKHPMGT